MQTTITILKTDLERNTNLGPELSQLSDRVKEFDDSCQYFPTGGRLVDFMRILMKYDLDYKLDYDLQK